jgi:hypothetical protein
MAVDTEKPDTAHVADLEKESSESPTTQATPYIPANDEEYNVTFKTWIVVCVSRDPSRKPIGFKAD